VARYCRLIAADLARRSPYAPFVDEEFLRNIPEAAILHDIGKLALPDSVLLKPDRLNPEEMKLAQSHAAVGRDICRSVKEQLECEDHRFIDMAIDVTGGHHERWDGRGYPDRLEGSNIPLSARIVSLADYYDIWRTPVVYRPEVLPVEDVVGRIDQQSGRKFDPVVVDAFNRCRHSFGEVEQRLTS
jgi:putative two-component system response regulator